MKKKKPTKLKLITQVGNNIQLVLPIVRTEYDEATDSVRCHVIWGDWETDVSWAVNMSKLDGRIIGSVVTQALHQCAAKGHPFTP